MNKMMFDEPLIEGVILSRKNQFIMLVKLGDDVINCHCPTNGRIGDIEIKNISCLLSRSRNPKRKTSYTVEAISLDPINKAEKQWIGINQIAVNGYVEYFIKEKMFENLFAGALSVNREVMLGNSKLDFLVDNTFLEVKTSLLNLQVSIPNYISRKKISKFQSTDRLQRHVLALANSLSINQRAILLNCFVYNNPGMEISTKYKTEGKAQRLELAIKDSISNGVELWQANFKIDKYGVSLSTYFNVTESFIS